MVSGGENDKQRQLEAEPCRFPDVESWFVSGILKPLHSVPFSASPTSPISGPFSLPLHLSCGRGAEDGHGPQRQSLHQLDSHQGECGLLLNQGLGWGPSSHLRWGSPTGALSPA